MRREQEAGEEERSEDVRKED